MPARQDELTFCPWQSLALSAKQDRWPEHPGKAWNTGIFPRSRPGSPALFRRHLEISQPGLTYLLHTEIEQKPVCCCQWVTRFQVDV